MSAEVLMATLFCLAPHFVPLFTRIMPLSESCQMRGEGEKVVPGKKE